jgi:hypothetical protein
MLLHCEVKDDLKRTFCFIQDFQFGEKLEAVMVGGGEVEGGW